MSTAMDDRATAMDDRVMSTSMTRIEDEDRNGNGGNDNQNTVGSDTTNQNGT